MIAAIHQPNYLPWLGYFYKIASCDVFVFLDNVEYSKEGFINRNKIKTPQGAIWLTTGVLTKGHHGQLINEVKINNSVPWSVIHRKSISQNYSSAKYFNEYFPSLENIYRETWERLADLNEALIRLMCKMLNIAGIKFVQASELSVPGKSTELLVNICNAVGADTYHSGPSGRNYMDEDLFKKQHIRLEYSNFKHPTYEQLGGDFIPNMSVIDLIFNEGRKSRDILKGGCGPMLKNI